jgi:hypothetical protein
MLESQNTLESGFGDFYAGRPRRLVAKGPGCSGRGRKIRSPSSNLSGLFSASVEVCTAGTNWCAINIGINNDVVMLKETSISIESNTSTTLTELRLEDTNPTYFALMYNTLKDAMWANNINMIRVFYIKGFVGVSGATYNKIAQSGVR